jgi:hypothetical protein
VLDEESGTCNCPEGTWELFDDYSGMSRCVGDDDPPPDCADDNAVYDGLTGECPCKEGYVPTHLEGYASPFCEPIPGDAGPEVRDAGADPPPDAGVVVRDAPIEIQRDATIAE